ncbi:MAG: redoxin domain-containing protein [Brevefilum sp.]|nr:redoxin domain-containing protein [Brevefilum sp.]
MATQRIKQGEPARDFALQDTQGETIKLSDFAGDKNVYLIFNRGFT